MDLLDGSWIYKEDSNLVRPKSPEELRKYNKPEIPKPELTPISERQIICYAGWQDHT